MSWFASARPLGLRQQMSDFKNRCHPPVIRDRRLKARSILPSYGIVDVSPIVYRVRSLAARSIRTLQDGIIKGPDRSRVSQGRHGGEVVDVYRPQ